MPPADPHDRPEPHALVQPSGRGLHCPAGGFHIDPGRPVERAVITHGQTAAFVRYLREQGHNAYALPTHYNDTTEPEDDTDAPA